MDEGSMKFGELYYVVNNENIVSYVRAFNGNDRYVSLSVRLTQPTFYHFTLGHALHKSTVFLTVL